MKIKIVSPTARRNKFDRHVEKSRALKMITVILLQLMPRRDDKQNCKLRVTRCTVRKTKIFIGERNVYYLVVVFVRLERESVEANYNRIALVSECRKWSWELHVGEQQVFSINTFARDHKEKEEKYHCAIITWRTPFCNNNKNCHI